MLDLFLNPGFLFVAAALVSVPIIIHLINRMRFKRIRWAAMEFLLKAQKRTRRRLIIEQLLLLALRCFLIGLVGLLVSRFIGCSDTGLGGKANLHIVLVDDTLSTQDQAKQIDGTFKSCFDVAKNDVLDNKIAKGLSQAKTNDRLVLLPLSKINDPDFQPKIYEGLVNSERLKELKQDIGEMKPSMLHVPMLQGVKLAEKIIANNGESRVTLHILSDFRHKDWAHPAGEGLTKALLELAARSKDTKIRPIDTVYPPRGAGQGSYPSSHDNVGIVDVRPSTRIVGKGMPVDFTITLQNFSGKYVDVNLTARDEATGRDMFEVNFNPQNPVKLSPGLTTVTFTKQFDAEVKPGETHFAHLTVRLTSPQMQPLDNDGLSADNLRHTVVEVRDRVPILVIDGDPKGRDEAKDSYHIMAALISVPGKYHVVFGDQLAGGTDRAKALERPDLNQYPTIFLLNVGHLTPLQLANLETYVKEGGGVAFYMGPLVEPAYYNKSLYKEGKGIFPVPLKDTYYPPASDDKGLPPKGSDTYHLLIRDDKFGDPRTVPIFGKVFTEPRHREVLRDLPIKRYYQVARNLWKPEPGRVFELATLPNEAPVSAFEQTVADITRGATVAAILANPELSKYKPRLEKHLKEIENTVRPGSEAKAYHLAAKIDSLLTDKGNAKLQEPDMTEFFANGDPKVQSLLRDLTSLRDQVSYGDPFIITQTYGKGKVVAVLSTAGKDWNDWGGGSLGSIVYPSFVWEMQKYLSSQGTEANLTVGANIDLVLDAEQFKGANLKMVRSFMKLQNEKPAERVKAGEQFGQESNGKIVFTMTKNLNPGLYVTEIVDDNTPGKAPLTVLGHAFNVDTTNEGDLQRVGSDELDRELISKSNGQIVMVAPGATDDALLGKFNDFSESPWLFLILLLVLVAEQALAVHLSFHMKANENEMAPAGARATA